MEIYTVSISVHLTVHIVSVKSIYWIAQFSNYESSKLNAWNYYKAHLSMEYLRFNKLL